MMTNFGLIVVDCYWQQSDIS